MYDQVILQVLSKRLQDKSDKIHNEMSPLEIRELSNTITYLQIFTETTLEQLDLENQEWQERGGEKEQVEANYRATEQIRLALNL